MKRNGFLKLLSFILCTVLIAATALFAAGCGNDAQNGAPDNGDSGSGGVTAELTDIGEGATEFTFIVVDPDRTTKAYNVHTDEETVGAALIGLDLIQGEDSTYGFIVNTVDGITLDFEKDGLYWAFYINDNYATDYVDRTAIKAGSTYSLKADE